MAVITVWFALILLSVVFGSVLLACGTARLCGKILVTIGTVLFTVPAALVGAIYIMLENPLGGFYAILYMTLLIIVAVMICCGVWGAYRRRAVSYTLWCAVLMTVIAGGARGIYDKYNASIPTIAEGDVITPYEPYGENTRIATTEGAATLRLTTELPRMDGATALYPVYAAFARAVYPREAIDGKNDYLKCSTTSGAYESIVDGDADIIFCAAPSEEQRAYAKERGVELIYTPIGKEAFVFFVNSKNPIEDITVESLRKIYSGEIGEWRDLGVRGMGKIRAFQREEGSGSQSALVRLMDGIELMSPPDEDVIDGMGGIITQTADYKNYKNAIGYSFRFYSTEMMKNGKIKLLKVDGVAPSIENIENGTYPIASYFYAVTRKDASENTRALLSWITSGQGQSLVEKTGYTPIR